MRTRKNFSVLTKGVALLARAPRFSFSFLPRRGPAAQLLIVPYLDPLARDTTGNHGLTYISIKQDVCTLVYFREATTTRTGLAVGEARGTCVHQHIHLINEQS